MKLSIITINYNDKVGLQKTINSVISQTFRDFEWIVIDGGSSDGSKELIEKYSEYINYWVSEPDQGVYNAMNKGIKVANGEYIQFLNSGDYLVSVNTLKNVFNRHLNADIIYGNSLYLYKSIVRVYNFSRSRLFIKDLIDGNINHQSMFYRCNLFDEYGLYDESYKLYADWKFNFITIGLNQCSTKYINEDIVYYDIGGISSTDKFAIKQESERLWAELLPECFYEDYKFNMNVSEIRKYKLSRSLYGLLYKLTLFYEKFFVMRNK